MTTVTPEPPTEIDFGAGRDAARERIAELDRQRQELALDSLHDQAAAGRLSKVETELAGAQAELEHLDLARAEQERRDLEARVAAEESARAEALADARRLQADREKAAVAVDRAIDEFVATMRAHAEIAKEQSLKLGAAGMKEVARGAAPRGFQIEGALALAIRKARAEGPVPALDRMPIIPVRFQRPLAEGDPHMVDATQ